MGLFVIKSLAELDDAHVNQAVSVFVDSFFPQLTFFSEKTWVLARALKHTFNKEHYFACLLDDRVVGIAGYSTNRKRAQSFDKAILMREFGTLRGWLGYWFLRQEMLKPLELSDNQCYIESVATDRDSRGKGVASALQQFMFDHLPYTDYILEVVDTNTNARRLYEKLGYVVFRTKKQRWFRKQAGFNERLYMIKSSGGAQ